MLDAEHWRVQAEEVRAAANEMKDSVARKILLKIAEEYEKLAQRAEARNLRKEPPRWNGAS